VRALRRENALAQSSPLYRSQGHVSRRGAQARIAWCNALLGNAVDVTWKRNGGEHAWSFLRISRVFDISGTERSCPGCIGCEQTVAKRDGRPKNASTGTGLSDVDISHDQSSRWQKFAAVPEEIFEREVKGKTHSGRCLVNSDQSDLLPKADIGSADGHVGFAPANRRHHSVILSPLESDTPGTSTTSAFAVATEILFVSRLRAMQ